MEFAGIAVSLLICLVSISMVIIGWDVIYKNARKIATRNEMFSQVNSIINEIYAARNDAIKYWSYPKGKFQKDESLLNTAVLTQAISSIDKRIDKLSNQGLFINYHRPLRQLRRNITLDMERPDHISVSDKTVKIEEIVHSADQLVHDLNESFSSFKTELTHSRQISV